MFAQDKNDFSSLAALYASPDGLLQGLVGTDQHGNNLAVSLPQALLRLKLIT